MPAGSRISRATATVSSGRAQREHGRCGLWRARDDGENRTPSKPRRHRRPRCWPWRWAERSERWVDDIEAPSPPIRAGRGEQDDPWPAWSDARTGRVCRWEAKQPEQARRGRIHSRAVSASGGRPPQSPGSNPGWHTIPLDGFDTYPTGPVDFRCRVHGQRYVDPDGPGVDHRSPLAAPGLHWRWQTPRAPRAAMGAGSFGALGWIPVGRGRRGLAVLAIIFGILGSVRARRAVAGGLRYRSRHRL